MKYIEKFIYVYELLRNNEVFYIGQTSTPQNRFNGHMAVHGKDIYMKIIDKFVDIEHKHIIEYLNKGCKLINKEIPERSDYKIGDILKSKSFKTITKIWDNNLQKNFKSIYECAKHYKISDYLIKSHLNGKKTKISKILNIEYGK